jgi:hypothetical protein
MNNSHDEIKNLLTASRKLLSGKKHVQEIVEIKKQYGIIVEQGMSTMTMSARNPIEKINVAKSIEDEIESDELENQEYETANTGEEKEAKDDMKQGYRISGGIMFIHGKDRKDVELLTDDKIAFQETMEEFVNEVSDLVEFNPLNLYSNNVEWSGKLIDFDLEFIFTIGEESGIYIDGEMTKISDEFEELIKKLKTYYQKFKSKWGKILGMRKKTIDKN